MARAPRFTRKRRQVFLTVLAEHGNLSEALKAAGISRPVAMASYETDEKFAEAWRAASDEAADRLEREARRRALEGTEEPVFYQGRECGRVRRYSDSLMLALLKAERPEKFKDRVASELSGEVKGGVLVVPQTLDPVRWAEAAEEYQRRLAHDGGR